MGGGRVWGGSGWMWTKKYNCENSKKMGVGGSEDPVWGIRVDVNEELSYCENAPKKSGGGGCEVRSGIGGGE